MKTRITALRPKNRRTPLRVGVIGLGMGKAHCLAALEGRGVELAAIAEPQAERVAQFRSIVADKHQQWQGALERVRIFDDFRAMADSGEVDAVVVALPTHMHAAASIDLLGRGVHVLCEKPPTVSAAEMRRVMRVAASSGRTYMFVRQQRFEPAKFAARELIAKGKLGTVFHAESQWLRTRGIPWRGGWGVNKDTGGGVLLDLGIHKLDDAWFVLGNPQPIEVFCATHCAYAHLAKGRKLSLPYNADDATFAMVRFADGSTLNMQVTFALTAHGPDAKPIESGLGDRDWQHLRIFGSHAGIDVGFRKLIVQRKDEVEVRPLPISKRIAQMKTGMTGQIENFAAAIASGSEPLNTAAQALQLMQMLDALKRSGATGKSVTIKAE